MRFLDKHELRLVSGAEWQCTPQNSGLDAGIANTRALSAQDVGPYYESSLPKGSKRLVEMLVESSFFTTYLAKKASLFFAAISGVGIIIVGFILFVTLQMSLSQQAATFIAQVITSTILFWLSTDIATMESSALILLNEYNCSVVEAPPIPSLIYKQYQDRLNTAWNSRKMDSSKKKV